MEKNSWLSGPNYDGILPRCEAGLDKIAARFAQKESRFWNSNLQIIGFERIREIAISLWARGTLPRRFCRAVAKARGGRRHMVYCWIGEETGVASFAVTRSSATEASPIGYAYTFAPAARRGRHLPE